jgi:excisionase family DNA binding protein
MDQALFEGMRKKYMKPDNRTESLFLRVDEAARLLQMSAPSIYVYLKSGQLAGTRIAGRWRVLRSGLDRFVEEANSRGYGGLTGRDKSQPEMDVR